MWDDAAGETFHCCRLSFSLAASSTCAAAALDRRAIFAETKAMDECAYFTRDAIGNLKSSIEALKRYMRDPPVWVCCACIILNPLCTWFWPRSSESSCESVDGSGRHSDAEKNCRWGIFIDVCVPPLHVMSYDAQGWWWYVCVIIAVEREKVDYTETASADARDRAHRGIIFDCSAVSASCHPLWWWQLLEKWQSRSALLNYAFSMQPTNVNFAATQRSWWTPFLFKRASFLNG